MAAPTAPPPDPLTLLRAAIAANTPPVPALDDEPQAESDFARATHLIFNSHSAADGAEHVAIPLSQSTRFVSGNGKALDLRSVYFCWVMRESSVSDYIIGIQRLNEELAKVQSTAEVVKNLVFAERLDLNNWLSGEAGEEESEYIRSVDDNKQTRREAKDAAATAKGGEDVEMRDVGVSEGEARKREEERLREIYGAERRMGDRNTVLRGIKPTDFSHVRKHATAFLSRSRPSQPAPALTSNPALRPPVKAPSGKRPEPIILLSPSASSLLRLPNIKSFLVDGLYAPPEATGSTANILHINRLLPSIDSSRPLRFILVDSPDNFRPDYWQRVVAVFTTGQTWQFKNYKWQQPAELFGHALGVYVGWRGEGVPDSVKGWGRGVLSVGIDKGGQRWRDREVVEEVWSAIEMRMRAGGWGKEAR